MPENNGLNYSLVKNMPDAVHNKHYLLPITYPCGFLIWVDARFPACCEVTEHFDGVSCAALVWINPVFT